MGFLFAIEAVVKKKPFVELIRPTYFDDWKEVGIFGRHHVENTLVRDHEAILQCDSEEVLEGASGITDGIDVATEETAIEGLPVDQFAVRNIHEVIFIVY